MATFLDLGLLNFFGRIFPALLIWLTLFAILEKTKFLSENKAINSMVAIVIALILMLSQDAIDVVNFITPWFVLMFIFAILLILLYQTMGATDENIADFLKKDKGIQWFIFVVGAIILLFGIGNVMGQTVGPYLGGGEVEQIANTTGGVATGSFTSNLTATLFHPKVIGLLFVFIIAAFTVGLLARSPKETS